MTKLTRREILAASAAMATGTFAFREAAFAKASQPSTPVNFAVPAGACDTHTHIFGDPKQFPMWPGRVYTPETALPDEMHALHQALHMQRVVIVTPSIYGTDNSATLYGMKAYGQGARGVAVIDDKTSESDLDAMGRAGIKGIRINLATVNQTDASVGRKRFQTAVDRVKARGWHIQMYVAATIIPGIKDLIAASPVPVVFDHFGGAETAKGMQQPGWPELLDLVKSGKAWVKISGAYRASMNGPEYADLVPYAKALIAANADRIVWGSDWPHPNSSPPAGRKATEWSPVFQIDDGRLLNLLPIWAPDAAVRKKILVDNPARLYGF
jgi:predicted TIM-barrel fold metal-dependent hydrolase